ncbi:uncharacterized protein LOC121762199 isoform X2 [Salvia splendens]|uniref:uncharacterized protein LOC121762199 isoform X2 n=1 Tax=Salvia splendens TaxID=180675 RepID=UPI001C272F4F|nr:uncharacterized protein LOC121762199 isoform X2 [Salvia splendens]
MYIICGDNSKSENNGKLPPFTEFFLKTHKLRNGDSQGELCSQRAQQIVAEEQQAEGIENPDHEAIFLKLFGKVKKRKQIYGAEQATRIYFPLATHSFVGSAPVNASQPGR